MDTSSSLQPTSTPAPTASSTEDGNLGPTCTTAIPGEYGNVPIDACNSNYNFDPQFAPAVAVCILFGLLTLAHVVLAFVLRKRYAWVLIMGASWETLAFALHAAGAHDQQNQGLATAHILLYLLAPLWINAFVYMTFARMAWFFLPDRRVWKFRAEGMSKWFVWADILSFIVQAIGGVMTTPGNSADTMKAGLNVYIAGIGLQEAFILCFLAVMVTFQVKARSLGRVGGFDALGGEYATRPKSWNGLLFALYAVLVFISVSQIRPSSCTSDVDILTQSRSVFFIAWLSSEVASTPPKTRSPLTRCIATLSMLS